MRMHAENLPDQGKNVTTSTIRNSAPGITYVLSR